MKTHLPTWKRAATIMIKGVEEGNPHCKKSIRGMARHTDSLTDKLANIRAYAAMLDEEGTKQGHRGNPGALMVKTIAYHLSQMAG